MLDKQKYNDNLHETSRVAYSVHTIRKQDAYSPTPHKKYILEINRFGIYIGNVQFHNITRNTVKKKGKKKFPLNTDLRANANTINIIQNSLS